MTRSYFDFSTEQRVQWFSFLRSHHMPKAVGKWLSFPNEVMGQCQHLNFTGLLWGVGEYRTELHACTIQYIFLPVSETTMICAISSPLPGPSKMTLHQPFFLCVIALRQTMPHRFLKRLLWFQEVWYFKPFSWSPLTFLSVRQPSKKPTCKDNHSLPRGEKIMSSSKRFQVFQRILCHHMLEVLLSISILKSPLNSCDPSPCNNCSRGSLRISTEVSTWQVFKASQACSVELAKIQSCATFSLLKQLKLESLKPSKSWHAS